MEGQPHQLWGVHEVAAYLGVPIATLYQWRHRAYGPRGRRVGRYIRYDPEDVRNWFSDQSETVT